MTTMERNNGYEIRYCFRLKDPVSALTHFAGFLAAITGLPVLLIRAAAYGCGTADMYACAVFMLSMILLYGASSAYHSFDISEKANLVLKKIDHLSIFVLIAGSYTPVCILGLGGVKGIILLTAIWTVAAAGMVFKLFWVTCPRWVSSVIYMCMGWMCAAVIPDLLHHLGLAAFLWLLAGGLLYSAGSVIYASKKDLLVTEGFGSHEIFHCFVLAGSICHFIFMYFYLTAVL